VEAEFVQQLAFGKVPDNDVGCDAGVGNLSAGDVATAPRDGDGADRIVVAREEALALLPGDLLDHDGRAQGVNEVLTVRVDLQAARDVTTESDHALQGERRHGYF